MQVASVSSACAVAALLMLLMLPSISAVAQPTLITNGNIEAAVDAWTTNSTTATTKYGDIAGWNVAAVTDMRELFFNMPAFNQNLGRWNVASVSEMNSMFYRAITFNQNIASWNTAKVSSMYGNRGISRLEPKEPATSGIGGFPNDALRDPHDGWNARARVHHLHRVESASDKVGMCV
jgi:hypothetical protein